MSYKYNEEEFEEVVVSNEGEAEEVVIPSRTSKKMKVDKSGSRRFKKLVGGILAVSVLVGCAVGGIRIYKARNDIPVIDESVASIVAYHEEKSMLDDVLAIQDGLEEQITDLERYIAVSNQLHALSLESYATGLKTVSVSEEQYSFETIEELMKQFELLKAKNVDVLSSESLQFYEVVTHLLAYQNLTDEIMGEIGYTSVIAYGEVLLKSTLLDASGLDATNYDNIELSYRYDISGKVQFTYQDPNTGKTFVIPVKEDTLADNLSKLMNKMALAKDDDTATKVANISEAINDFKVIQFLNYSNNGNLIQSSNYLDAKKAYQEFLDQQNETEKTKAIGTIES